MATIDDRVLLFPQLLIEKQVFVIVSNMFDTDSRICLGVFVPGGTKERCSQLCSELSDYLHKALIGIDGNWVVEVGTEKSLISSEDEVVVMINDARLMRDESEGLIMDAVRPFMTIRARLMNRRLIILGARQLLVSLNFEYYNILKNFVTLQLPKEMQLVDVFESGVAPGNIERYDRTCSLLEESLKAALITKDISLRLLDFKPTRDGLRLEVMFNGTNPPNAYQLNTFEITVAKVLSAYCRYADTEYSELVFQPVRPHDADIDDGSKAENY